jgi:superfamily II DNA/RNA helicase
MDHQIRTVTATDKVAVAAELAGRPGRRLVFVRTKHRAARLARQLDRAGVRAGALHGNLAQPARTRALAAFAAGTVPVLVATDIAARGLHVDGIGQVVHFDPPAEPKAYLHRSGRTAARPYGPRRRTTSLPTSPNLRPVLAG